MQSALHNLERISREFSIEYKKEKEKENKKLLQRFPFCECNSIYLKDTKKTVREGLLRSIQNYIQMTSTSNLECLEDEDQKSEDLTDSDFEDTIENGKTHPIRMNSDLVDILSPSSLFENQTQVKILKNDLESCSIPQRIAIEKIKELTAEKFDVIMEDDDLSNMSNFIVNIILLDFHDLGINDVCNKIIDKKNKDSLVEKIEECFLEKFVICKMDSLFDQYTEMISNFDKISSSEKLSFFLSFKKIWQFEPSEYDCYSYEDYERAYRVFPLGESNETLRLRNYVCNAFLMNIEKLLTYYGKEWNEGYFIDSEFELKPTNFSFCSNGTENSFDSVTQRFLKSCLVITLASSSSSQYGSIEKSVHFNDEAETVNFDDQEPSIYVFCDLNNIEMSEK
ncbi:uncharacterized protein PRCAT00002631001 [Priceomyces carsonii]|uniref:uncharacterized protein n=1 Tax=Priceomyces carsonii TaxID=28549 RepID=UPI002EDA661F|nr:unnamed protein product [Priceomyces carsonii]